MKNMGINFPWAKATSVAVAGVTEPPLATNTSLPATTASLASTTTAVTTAPPAIPLPASPPNGESLYEDEEFQVAESQHNLLLSGEELGPKDEDTLSIYGH